MSEGGQERRGAGGADDGTEHRAEGSRHVVNWLERLVSGVSLLLLLGAIGYLVWEGMRPAQPPSFAAEVREIRETTAGFDVRLVVRNDGSESVQNLTVRARVDDAGEILAEAETTLDWLPASSSRQAAVILPIDPRAHTLEVVFVGYELP